jgi:drug/metabolite transporter (DMT)-like permease
MPLAMSKTFTPRTTGIVLVLISALVFSTAGIFTRAITASAWDIIFWRGLFGIVFTLGYTGWRGTSKNEFLNMGKSGLASAIVGASGTAAYIPAFKLTTIANVSLIYAATPLIAAFLAWIWMGERATKLVLVAGLITLLGVAIVVSGSFGGLHLKGDLLACWMAIAMAVGFVIYRKYPQTPAAGPSALSSLLLMPFALAFGAPFADSLPEIITMIGFGAVFAIASITLSEGAKRLPAGETSLLSILEVVFAPLFAWMMFSEVPAIASFVGGAMILAAVVASQVWAEAAKP